MLIPKDFTDLIGYKYSKDVVSGKIISNEYVKRECEKYIDRLENKQYQDDFDFYFNMQEMKIIYGLLHYTNYATGFSTGQPIINHIAGFQAMIIENVFGWFAKDGSSQKMIQEVILQISRKNGKSFLSALIEIIILLRAPMFAQTAIAGKTREISSLIKKEMEAIIRSSPKLVKMFKITREKIMCKHNEATCHALSGEAQNLLGKLLTTFIVDEVANQLTPDIVDALKLSQMSVNSSRLAIYISTAFDNEQNVFKDMVDWYKKVLDGALEDSGNTFGLIYELDADDDYTDSTKWEKASPLQMASWNKDGQKFLMNQFNQAIEIPAKMRNFRVFILNQYLPSAKVESYIPISYIKECVIPREEFSFKGKNVYVGVDASISSDNTSVSIVSLDKGNIYVKSMCFIPQDKIMEKSVKEKCDYRRFISEGDCIPCGERTINYTVLEDYILNIEKLLGCKVVGVAYDRWNFLSSATKLEAKGLRMIDTPMHSKVLSPIYKLLEEKVLNKEICFLENGLLLDNFANCRCKYSENMDKYITKKSSNGKIDMVISLALALTQLEEKELRYKRKQFISYDL